MVQIIPRVIFTLPSTISKKENDFITFLFWFSSLFLPSAPMETNLTPLLAMKSRALLTLAILWNLKSCTNNFPGSKMHHWLFIQVDKGLKKWRWKLPISDWNTHLILPLSGLGRVSPEMTSRSSMSFRPFLKSSSMFSIWVPAFLKWELTQAVKVWTEIENRNAFHNS